MELPPRTSARQPAKSRPPGIAVSSHQSPSHKFNKFPYSFTLAPYPLGTQTLAVPEIPCSPAQRILSPPRLCYLRCHEIERSSKRLHYRASIEGFDGSRQGEFKIQPSRSFGGIEASASSRSLP